MNTIDNYLKSLKFQDSHPKIERTTFVEVLCACGARYATRLALYDTEEGIGQEPASQRSIDESEAHCPVCGKAIKEASSVAMYYGEHGVAIKFLNKGD